MGLWDSIFGGEDSSQKSKTSSSSQTTKEETADTANVKQTASQTEGAATTEQTQTQNTLQFTPEQMNTINALIQKAAAKETIYSNGTTDLATLAGNVAQTLKGNLESSLDVDTLVDNAKNAVKLDFEESVAPELTRFAGAVGSEGNSAVQLMRTKANTDLATKLFATEGDIRLKAQQQNFEGGALTMDAISKALTGSQTTDMGSSQALRDALAALETAKGGQVTTIGQGVTSGTTSQKSTESEISEQIAKILTNIKSTEQSSSKGSGSSSGSALNLIDTLLSAFSGASSYGNPA